MAEATIPAEYEQDEQDPGNTTSGKFLELHVPDFNPGTKAPGTHVAMTSYLRLGAAVANAGKNDGSDTAIERGGKLASLVTTFVDDTRNRGEPHPGQPEKSGKPTAPGHKFSVKERQDESTKLHDRGGWRDHSGGNRITTTQGDKVEVIRGNYKLIVLGRQDDLEHAAGWDLSGGHIQGSDLENDTAADRQFPSNPPKLEKTIEWVRTWGGTWKVTEKIEKGDEYIIAWGDSVEEFYGNTKNEIIGTETPYQGPNWERGNPVITGRTWAKSITEEIGSETLPVLAITGTTWVETKTETTHATSISETTHAGSISENRYARSSEAYSELNTKTETTLAGGINELTLAGMIFEEKIAGGIGEVKVGVMLADLKAAALTFELTAAPAIIEGHLGKKVDLNENLTQITKMKTALNAEETTVQIRRTVQNSPRQRRR